MICSKNPLTLLLPPIFLCFVLLWILVVPLLHGTGGIVDDITLVGCGTADGPLIGALTVGAGLVHGIPPIQANVGIIFDRVGIPDGTGTVPPPPGIEYKCTA
jgi:hypothetical protein